MKNKPLSKENSAAEGGKNLFTQPQPFYTIPPNKILRGEAGDTTGK
jgi:hypothetical protein